MGITPRKAKVELYALVGANGVLAKVQAAADARRKAWVTTHKAALRSNEWMRAGHPQRLCAEA